MAKPKYENTIGNLIELLTEIKNKYGEDVPVSVNLYNDRVLALQSICLDNDMEEVQVLFEADRDNSLEQTQEFMFYTQGEEL
jgi:hypothetical protein